jgi:hypothetical protein
MEPRLIIEELSKIINDTADVNDPIFQKRLNVLMKGDILHKEIKQLNDYRKAEKGKISIKYRIRLDQYKLLFLFYNEIISAIGIAWEESKNKNKTQFRIHTTTRLYYKSLQIILDLLAVFENGALTSSLSLWRSIYENFVFSKYLLESPEEESERYNDFSVIQCSIISKNYAEKNSDYIEALKLKYGDTFSPPYGWITRTKRQSIDGIIRKVHEKEFINYYRFSSMQLHASPLSVNKSYLKQNGHGNADMLGVFHEDFRLPYNIVIGVMRAYTQMMIKFFLEPEGDGLCSACNSILSALAVIQDGE